VTIGSADPLHVAARVAAALDALDVAYSIGGSLAGSFAGEPRATLDIDMVVALEATHVPALVRALENDFYIDSDALHRAVTERSTTNLIHQRTSIKVDLFVAGGTPLDEALLRRRVRLSGQDLWVHSPEDILLQKLRWFRRGGDVSDRQWRDVLGIVRVQGQRLDHEYLAAGALRLQVRDLLERALEEGRRGTSDRQSRITDH
jgi:hypothetical protein